MKLLVLGGGGREHALVWKLAQSPLVTKIICAPGNPGIAEIAECLAVTMSDPAEVTAIAKARAIDLVIIGPEAPLVAGVADALRAAGIDVFGPGAAAAKIEGSKAFAKEIMFAAKVPTAHSEVFTDSTAAAARALEWGPVVVKADGLAAGKGVVVADSGDEAAAACRSLGALPAGRTLLLEERLFGPELSVIALCDGERFVLLSPAQDHKRLCDDDLGPNTGGMGAYAPARLLSDADLAAIGEQVITPTLRELAKRGTPFRGALYAGLMLTPEGPKVLEFNARLGDPETQPLVMQLDEDLVPLLRDCARGSLSPRPLKFAKGSTVAIVLAAHGYPEAPRAGDVIWGLGAVPRDAIVFHAGTKRSGAEVVTAGGRVLTVCARGPTFGHARAQAYAAVEAIRFEGMQFRRDIGAKAPK